MRCWLARMQPLKGERRERERGESSDKTTQYQFDLKAAVRLTDAVMKLLLSFSCSFSFISSLAFLCLPMTPQYPARPKTLPFPPSLSLFLCFPFSLFLFIICQSFVNCRETMVKPRRN